MPIMLFVIMTILMFQLEAYRPHDNGFTHSPLGLIGVVLALNITRTPLGFMAILGIIALSGMIVRNSIILLDQIEIHKAEGQNLVKRLSTPLHFVSALSCSPLSQRF